MRSRAELSLIRKEIALLMLSVDVQRDGEKKGRLLPRQKKFVSENFPFSCSARRVAGDERKFSL